MSTNYFSQIPLWHRTFKRVINLYKITEGFMNEEKYAIISDARRAVNSGTGNKPKDPADMIKEKRPGFIKFPGAVAMI